MNLFVTIIFATCLGIAAYWPPVRIENSTQWLSLIIFVTLLAPATAVLQTRWVADSLTKSRSSWDLQNAILGRLSRFHSIVWATTGILIFAGLGWPSIVAVSWKLTDVPILYELVLISPLLLSLIGSWFAFFDIQQFYGRTTKRWSLNWQQRWEFVSVRIRVHLVTMLVPLLLLLTGLRYWHVLQRFTVPQIVIGTALLGIWISAMMPFLFLLIWETRPITDGKLLTRLQAVCRSSGVSVSKIRVWKTGNQIANAAVTGLLPGFRIVLLTDALIKYFLPEEVAAIVRHEAGHVKLLHLPLKIFFIALPMVTLILDQTQSIGIHGAIESAVGPSGIFHVPADAIAQGLIALAFLGYLFFVLRWLNHRLEHEADLFAAMELNEPTANDANAHTRSALEKLAAITPQHRKRSTFLHPSIGSRIALLNSVADDHEIAKRFQTSFRRRNWMILVPWVVVLLVTTTAYFVN